MSTTQQQSDRPAQKGRTSLWHNRDYLLLWGGQAISSIGGGISQLAFPFLLLAITGSPLAAAIAGALNAFPRVFIVLFAGALIDRWNRKYVMIICDIGRACALGSIPIAMALHHITVWQLYLCALLEGILVVFFSVAHSSSLGQVVPTEQLSFAMAQEELVEGATDLIGPAIAGPLFTLSHILPFLSDAISYVVSLVSLFLIRTPFQTPRVQQHRHLLLEIRDGLRWMWQQPVLRTMNLLNVPAALVTPGMTLLIVVLGEQNHISTSIITIIYACGGLGAIMGTLVAPYTTRWLNVGQSIILTRWAFALLWLGYLIAHQPLLLGLVQFSIGFMDPLEDIAYFSYRLAITPNELRGRVISVGRIFPGISNPIGQILTGLLLQYQNSAVTVIAGSLIMALVATGFMLEPHVRHARMPA